MELTCMIAPGRDSIMVGIKPRSGRTALRRLSSGVGTTARGELGEPAGGFGRSSTGNMEDDLRAAVAGEQLDHRVGLAGTRR
jgi:hypothetical protein